MLEQATVWCAQPPWHRVERAMDGDGQTLRLLTALNPAHGWPQRWICVPVQWRGADVFERVDLLMFQAEFRRPGGRPGEPLRLALAADQFPAQGGFLCLFVYLDPRASAQEGAHQLDAADAPQSDLNRAVDGLMRTPPHEWAHAYVPNPRWPQPEGLSLLLAACQFPPGMLDVSRGAERDPALASPAEAAMARMVAFCRSQPDGQQASLLLIAGDEIYADASGGLADANSSVERYATPYQHFKAGLIRHLPPSLARIVHAPDDHEVEDNCEPCLRSDGCLDYSAYFASARAAAWHYRWEPGIRAGEDEPVPPFWHSFEWRGAAFFVADSRLEREPRTVARVAEAQMISAAQRAGLASWLAANAGRPRFVLSGALLLPRRRSSAEHLSGALRSDAWCGFPVSLHGLLAELWRQQASGVVFLSGDEHRSGHVSAELGLADGSGERLRVHAIHSSALYAPWPFAITAPEEFAAPDEFEVSAGGQVLRCQVGAWHDHPGDGFAFLRLQGRELQLWFDKAGDRALHAHVELRDPDARLNMV